MNIDLCFVTATCAKDIHYAKVLIASIAYFYPQHPIYILIDSDVSNRHRQQLARFPHTTLFSSPALSRENKLPAGGLLCKLNVPFFNDHEYFAFFDADSVLIGAVFDHLDFNFDFCSLDGREIDVTRPENRRKYGDMAVDLDKILSLDPEFKVTTPILFCSGHWVFKAGTFPLDLIKSTSHLISPGRDKEGAFSYGDQGFYNYAVNKSFEKGKSLKWHSLVRTARKLTPADYSFINLENLKAKTIKKVCILHYTGPSRRFFLSNHTCGFILTYFNKAYYQRLPGSARIRDTAEKVIKHILFNIKPRSIYLNIINLFKKIIT